MSTQNNNIDPDMLKNLMAMMQNQSNPLGSVAQGVGQGASSIVGGAGAAAGGGGGILGALGGQAGGGIGGNLSPISMAAGLAGDLMTSFAPKLTSNAGVTESSGYDFTADLTANQMAKKDKRDGIANTALGALEGIPLIGGFASGLKGLFNMGSGLFQKKATAQDKIDEQYSMYQGEAAQDKQNLYANAFETDYLAALGGYMEDKIMSTGGPVEVGVGGTHEQNPQNGVTISPGNKAEEGEVVVDLNGGQFVFTNRF